MSDFNMPADLLEALTDHFSPNLFATEDFESFESTLTVNMRVCAAQVLKNSIERFDRSLCENKPKGWTVHAKEKRRLITLVGRIEFCRTCFKDEFGRRRLLLDELLGIIPKSALSQGAFLWIVNRVSELSYRKVAKQFKEHTGTSISHVSVMHVVHEEGRLLKAQKASGKKISHPSLSVEVDGVWIHLQKPHHRQFALPRHIYEQAKKTASFELKVACVYAGKVKQNNKTKRAGLSVSCFDGQTDPFWEHVWQMICDSFDEQDIEHVCVGADGASWCMADVLTELMSKTVRIDYHLDLFHLMQAVTRAFPQGPARQKAKSLIFSAKALTLAKAADKIACTIDDKQRKKKLKDLSCYIKNHLPEIVPGAPSLGTMEGTIAHVVAPRLKRQGRSWSKHGAEAMALIRCAITCEKPLVAPQRSPFFTEREIRIKEKALQKIGAHNTARFEGNGYEFPFQVSFQSLPRKAQYIANTR